MGSKTDFFENKVLDMALRNITYTQPATIYSALFTVIPSDSTGGTEVTNASSGYTRVACTFCTAGATTPGQSVNVGAVTFATMAASVTVVGFGLMDTSTVGAGNMLYWATITTLALAVGDQATFGIGAMIVTED
jgi:hypothetical protein